MGILRRRRGRVGLRIRMALDGLTKDDLKLWSCITLFAETAPEETAFQKVLDRFYSGEKDSRTMELLRK